MRPNPKRANRFQVPSDAADERTHHHNVARPVLDGAKEAEDDHDDVEEVGEDWSPLVAQEVKDLPFQGHNLRSGRQKKQKKTDKCYEACSVLEAVDCVDCRTPTVGAPRGEERSFRKINNDRFIDSTPAELERSFTFHHFASRV